MNTSQRLATLALLVIGLLIATDQARAADPTPAKTSKADPKKEFAETKAKAEQGDAKQQLQLGILYAEGQGVETNFVDAAKWYRKAADQGVAIAQDNLGLSFFYGRGVETNFVEAAKWFRKAADQGISFAKCNLGALYFLGKGVEMDYAEARKWFTQAADEGDASAQINMGALYEHGHGVEANSAEVVKWYRKAADQGGAYAAFHMGEVLADTDKVEGYAWFSLAAKSVTEAATARDRLGKQLSLQQIAEAQKRTKELRAMIDAKMNAASK